MKPSSKQSPENERISFEVEQIEARMKIIKAERSERLKFSTITQASAKKAQPTASQEPTQR